MFTTLHFRLLDCLRNFVPLGNRLELPQVSHSEMPYCAARSVLWRSSLIIRLAGLSGAAAVSLGAYGAHGLRQKEGIDAKRIRSYDQGSRYHLLHSLALLGAPLARFPLLTVSERMVHTVYVKRKA
ncbi:Transmembrane protein [Toxocara canis]|uniref:Transmembrane protein n=1 Tax=Toxocara canis TaxID=6265 RepID=A0A0B2VVT0_TOXCA|nr:Transmembrane protein [Toxocara canis]